MGNREGLAVSDAPNMNAPFDWMGAAAQHVGEATAEEIAANEQAVAAANQAQLEFALLVNEVLGSGRGAELLAALREVTIELSHMNVGDVIGMDGSQVQLSPSDWSWYREGQNQLIRWLEANVRFAQRPPDPDTGQPTKATTKKGSKK